MKALKRITCVVLAMVLVSVNMASASALTQIENQKLPLGVGDVTAQAPGAPQTAQNDQLDEIVVSTSLSSQGIVAVDIKTNSTSRMKLKVAKGNEALYYDVDSDHHVDVPLQMGDGAYTIKVFRHIVKNDYQAVYTEDVSFTAQNPNDVFLASSDIVNMRASSNVSTLTQDVVGNATDDRKKVERIAGFVVQDFKYDKHKVGTLTTDYIPNIDTVISDKSGICYDFAALTAAMLRQAGIPAKLVMGYRNDSEVYHAWNEVLVDGEWLVIDTTWDNVNHNKQMSFQNPGLYSAEKVF